MTENERAELEAKLGRCFRDPRRLAQALTHRSLRPEKPGSDPGADNEQLEFLGDAVLALVVSEALLAAFPGWSEGELSKSRARLVNTESLQRAAQRLDLGRYLQLGRGEEKTGGREKASLLAGAYEAVVAAVYADGGLAAAAEFLRRSLLDDELREQGAALGRLDHKSALQEWLQARGSRPAEYRVARESGPDHQKQFFVEVIVEGRPVAGAEGRSKKEAEQLAAQLALEALRGEPAAD